jgi:HrpA-like RNA helicase
VVGALEQLYALEALDETGSLTSLGKQMSHFPVDPTFAKVLIQSKVRIVNHRNSNAPRKPLM